MKSLHPVSVLPTWPAKTHDGFRFVQGWLR